jgi:hypothetical protein
VGGILRGDGGDAMSADVKPILHVVFDVSAAHLVREGLALVGRGERVIGLLDNLSFGPVDSTDANRRRRQIESVFGFDFEGVVETVDGFWAEATSSDTLPIAWVCRHNASEHAGFLEFIRRIADAPFEVVDATSVEFALRDGRRRLTALYLATPEQIVETRLPDRRRELSPHEIEAYRETWRRLRTENAPLRVVDETGLVSAPITHYDDEILSCASDEWQKGARLVGTTMVTLWEAPLHQCPGDLILWSRVCALADAGVLELTGDRSKMGDSLVRRAPRRSGAEGERR